MGYTGRGKQVLSANVTEELYGYIEALAKKTKRTKSFIAGEILTAWYEARKRGEARGVLELIDDELKRRGGEPPKSP